MNHTTNITDTDLCWNTFLSKYICFDIYIFEYTMDNSQYLHLERLLGSNGYNVMQI